jgi:hypothetical protein
MLQEDLSAAELEPNNKLSFSLNKKESLGQYSFICSEVYLPKQSPLGFDTWQLLSEKVF